MNDKQTVTEAPCETGRQVLNDDLRERIRAYLPRYPSPRAVVLPALHLIQQELGWVSPQAVRELATLLGIPAPEIQDTLSFYGFFKQQKPLGKYRVWVCRSLSCAICGGEDLLGYLQEKWRIEPGDTTADGRFTLEAAECLGACEMAPAVLINESIHARVTREKLDEILDQLP
ncbi:NADH-quinone oxidoreductase subunit NuoE [Thermogutta sp.]|uniref:NADH-quinone oxidoreductase subunit NuoE family protein n=1 Tax=Thermogutta sp. TaxID=1962930 RepID=UPI00321F97DA